VLGYLKKKLECVFAHENIKKKLASKVAYFWQFGFFFSLSAALNGPRLEIHTGNVSQDTSVL
jgi:hypothetical protein